MHLYSKHQKHWLSKTTKCSLVSKWKRNVYWKGNFNNLHINFTKSVIPSGHGLELQVPTLALICCPRWQYACSQHCDTNFQHASRKFSLNRATNSKSSTGLLPLEFQVVQNKQFCTDISKQECTKFNQNKNVSLTPPCLQINTRVTGNACQYQTVHQNLVGLRAGKEQVYSSLVQHEPSDPDVRPCQSRRTYEQFWWEFSNFLVFPDL